MNSKKELVYYHDLHDLESDVLSISEEVKGLKEVFGEDLEKIRQDLSRLENRVQDLERLFKKLVKIIEDGKVLMFLHDLMQERRRRR